MDQQYSNGNVTDNERRSYFRLKTDVLLRYQTIDQSQAQANQVPASFSKALRYTLMRELQVIDQESHNALRCVADHNREVATCLKSINKKIDILASTLVNALEPIADQPRRHVTLSEGGLSFTAPGALKTGGYLALELTLLPSYVTLVLFAQIIHCLAQHNEFKIAVNFVHLKDGDRQLLARHILQLQLTAKRHQQTRQDNL